MFSSVGNVVAKLRARLNDETVNALVFLKTYYAFGPKMSVCICSL